MNNKVLCIDDDANILTAIQRNLRKQFDLDTAVGALAALKMIENECPYAVIVADMQMPSMNGVEFLNIVRQKYPDTVRVMLTGNADQKTATDAVNRGQIFQFLNKPCPPERLAEVLTGGIKHYRLVTAERELLENTLNGSVKVLMEILSLSDPASFGRGQAVRDQARQVAQALQLKSTWELDLAAMLCPIGNVSLPAELNQKVHAELDLTGAEKDAVARVPQVGHDLLIKIPRLEAVARIVLYQNKNFDGTGFPSDAVKSEEIPVEARILRALTDLAKLEARKIPRFKALDQLRQQPGHYDLKVLDAVARCFHLTPGSQPEAAAKSSVALDFPDLRPGHVLSANIVTKQDILIVGAGTKITPLILERLRNFASLSGLKLPIYVEG
jgi:response regulator RpfG family c-di-GMP phosphodiesterase